MSVWEREIKYVITCVFVYACESVWAWSCKSMCECMWVAFKEWNNRNLTQSVLCDHIHVALWCRLNGSPVRVSESVWNREKITHIHTHLYIHTHIHTHTHTHSPNFSSTPFSLSVTHLNKLPIKRDMKRAWTITAIDNEGVRTYTQRHLCENGKSGK